MSISHNKFAMMAAISAWALDNCAFPGYSSKEEDIRPTRGRVVGHDMGTGRKRQPRNSPCACGSGLKAKKFCVYTKQENS